MDGNLKFAIGAAILVFVGIVLFSALAISYA
jgi:hypothetical protein